MSNRPSISNAAASRSIALRAVAMFEAFKGLVVLLIGSGLLMLVHRDVQAAAERLIARIHLDPTSRYAGILMRAADAATPGRLRLIALGALLYAVMRCVEAVGLWKERRWAEWFGVVSGLAYVPFEASSLLRRPRLEALIALSVNIVVVLFLAYRLRTGTEVHSKSEEAPSS